MYEVRSSSLATLKERLMNSASSFLPLSFAYARPAAVIAFADGLKFAGQLLGLGVQAGLVFDVADRDALGGGDAAAEVGGVGELHPPAFGEVEGAVVEAAAFLRVDVERL